jgi:hypothetical protein
MQRAAPLLAGRARMMLLAAWGVKGWVDGILSSQKQSTTRHSHLEIMIDDDDGRRRSTKPVEE